jgi:L-iditol 2-dehydrogenase
MEGIELGAVMECTGMESSITGTIQSIKFRGTVFVVGVGKMETKLPFIRKST